MAWPDFTYDNWYTWASLHDDWIVTVDADTNISYAAGGMTINHIGATAGAEAAYHRRALGHDHISIGFWLTIPAIGDGDTGALTILCVNDSTSYDSNRTIQLQLYKASGGHVYAWQMKNNAGTQSTAIDAGPGTFWFALEIVRNGTSTLSIYTDGGDLVDSQTLTAGDFAGTYLWAGLLTGGAPATNMAEVWKDMVIDSTDYTFPLLGWETGGGGSSIVAIAQAYTRRWRG